MFPQTPPSSHQPFAIIIPVTLDPADLADAALHDTEAEPADRALVSLTCTLLQASEHPEFLTETRLSRMAPLLRLVLDQGEPDASECLQTLWDFVDDCFGEGSSVRRIFLDVVAERSNERFASIVAGSVVVLGPH
jgi:hypothetical protein